MQICVNGGILQLQGDFPDSRAHRPPLGVLLRFWVPEDDEDVSLEVVLALDQILVVELLEKLCLTETLLGETKDQLAALLCQIGNWRIVVPLRGLNPLTVPEGGVGEALELDGLVEQFLA